jgi:hypothetical protein
MPLIVKDDPAQYPLAPDGLHLGVLVDAVDIGEVETAFGIKHKLSLIFELEATDENGKHFIVGKRYNWSLNEKSTLRKDLERWLGRKYTSQELKSGIDLEELLGRNANIFISHKEVEDKTFANIETILPPDKVAGKVNWYGVKSSGTYTRVTQREGYLEPQQFAEQQRLKKAG